MMKALVRLVAAVALSCLFGNGALAQSFFTTPGGAVVNGVVQMCINGTGFAVPCSGSSGVPQSSNITQIGGTAIGAQAHANTTALANSLAVKASAGSLYAFNCTAITGGAAGFCVAYNATAAPGAGALTGSLVLDVCAFDSGNKGCSLSRIPMGVAYATGIVILVTSATTPFTYTTGTDTAYISADYQ